MKTTEEKKTTTPEKRSKVEKTAKTDKVEKTVKSEKVNETKKSSKYQPKRLAKGKLTIGNKSYCIMAVTILMVIIALTISVVNAVNIAKDNRIEEVPQNDIVADVNTGFELVTDEEHTAEEQNEEQFTCVSSTTSNGEFVLLQSGDSPFTRIDEDPTGNDCVIGFNNVKIVMNVPDYGSVNEGHSNFILEGNYERAEYSYEAEETTEEVVETTEEVVETTEEVVETTEEAEETTEEVVETTEEVNSDIGIYLRAGCTAESIGSQEMHDGIMAYWPYVKQAAEAYDFPIDWIYAVILEESGAKNVTNGAAIGPMQLEASVWTKMGYTQDQLWDPEQNIMIATKFLSELYVKYGYNIYEALGCYGRGQGGWNLLKKNSGIYDRTVDSFEEAVQVLKNAGDINYIWKMNDWHNKFMECYSIY